MFPLRPAHQDQQRLAAAACCQVEVIVRVTRYRIQSVARVTDPVRQRKRFVGRQYVGRVPRLVRRSRAEDGSGPARIWHLTQRKIFGEPRSRELFSRTRQQREKRATGWMRPSCASVEPCRYAGPPKRMFEQAEVAVGGTNEDRHLVEQHARPCFSKHPARHFNAFATLARRRKELDGPVELAHRRMTLGVEEESTDTRQVVERIRAFRFQNHSAHAPRNAEPCRDPQTVLSRGQSRRWLSGPRRTLAPRHDPARCRAARPSRRSCDRLPSSRLEALPRLCERGQLDRPTARRRSRRRSVRAKSPGQDPPAVRAKARARRSSQGGAPAAFSPVPVESQVSPRPGQSTGARRHVSPRMRLAWRQPLRQAWCWPTFDPSRVRPARSLRQAG